MAVESETVVVPLTSGNIFRQRVHAKVVPASAKSGLLYEITISPLSLLLRPNKAHVRPNAFHYSTFCMRQISYGVGQFKKYLCRLNASWSNTLIATPTFRLERAPWDPPVTMPLNFL